MSTDLQGFVTLGAVALAVIWFTIYAWTERRAERRNPYFLQSRINRLEHSTHVIPDDYVHEQGMCIECQGKRNYSKW